MHKLPNLLFFLSLFQNQKMRIVTSTIIILYFTLMVSANCASSPEVLLTEIYATEEKDRPFETPNDLRSHLNNLSHYYAVVGRPRYYLLTVNR